MPKRLSTLEALARFDEYGYSVVDREHYVYTNSKVKTRVYDERNERYEYLSINTLMQRVRKGTRQPYEQPLILRMPLDEHETQPTGSSFDRFVSKHHTEFTDYDDEHKHIAFDYFKQYMPIIRNMRNRTLNVDSTNNTAAVHGFAIALKELLPRLVDKDIRLTITDEDGAVHYAHANENTITALNQFYQQDMDISDSSDVFVNSLMKVKTIGIEFVPRTHGARIAAGFFPYINVSDVDLSKFGIYSTVDDPRINDSCLLTALASSNQLTDNEINQLRSFIRTRIVPRTVLADIAKLLNICIQLRVYYPTKKTSMKRYNEQHSIRLIKIVLFEDHYMIDECPQPHVHITTLINRMRNAGSLVPMTIEQIQKLRYSFVYENRPFNVNKQITLKMPIQDSHHCQAKHTKHFFGYTPDSDEDERKQLDILQSTIDSLPLRNHIEVKYYYKFSQLMQRVMFEYGCFDRVTESSGVDNMKIRNSLKFPKVMNYIDEADEKLYYIDINSAYMSCVDGIPLDLNSSIRNTRVSKLIHQLYDIRTKAKAEGNTKLATTLKFMMNSCYGYSMRKPSIIKNKYTSNVDNYLNEFAPYVVSWKYAGDDHVAGYVTTINPYVPSYNYVQFAKRILDNYHRMFTNIKKQVNVLFENVDAILINEDDYKKLESLGYIGNQLGQFKIEHVFTSIKFITPRRWYAKLENGEMYYHQM